MLTNFQGNETEIESCLEKKIQNGWLRKFDFLNFVNIQRFYAKISGIGLGSVEEIGV